ncbi:hypothetical protein VIBR0546_18912 [Vibrio brasiliensis LMG 20546]|uniref:Uncharacterized protein n=1 Tax=Vibrio brasiliensis LMG 20546 TaxID=945543 RepID=E8LPK2_9VIBR|nr:hypothetical protein VIBR0546_18912 [Vibrio brasiliensis LMG 20546]
MSKKDTDMDDDFALFRDAVQGVKKLSQDTIVQQPKKILSKKKLSVVAVKQATVSFTSLTNLCHCSTKMGRLATHAMMSRNTK